MTDSSLLSEEVLLHGLNLSKRMDASLEVLHLLKKEPGQNSLQSFKKQIGQINPEEAIGYIQLLNKRGLTSETVDYARNRRNIICVFLCLKGKGVPHKKGIRKKRFAEVTKLLNCPVVLYSDKPIPPTSTDEAHCVNITDKNIKSHQ